MHPVYDVVWDGARERAGDCLSIRGLQAETYVPPPPVTRPPQIGRTRPRQKKPAPTPALDGNRQRRRVRDVPLPPAQERLHTGTPVEPRPDRRPKTARRVGTITTRASLKAARHRARRGLAAAQETGDLAGAVQWADRLRELDRQFFGDDLDAYQRTLKRSQSDGAANARLRKADEYYGRGWAVVKRRDPRLGAVFTDHGSGLRFEVVWSGGPGLSQCRQISHVWRVMAFYAWRYWEDAA